MLTLTNIFHAAQIAVCVRVFLALTESGQVLEIYGRFLTWLEWRSPTLYKPLGGCLNCLTGQMGLWISAAMFGLSIKIIPFTLITIFFQIWLSEYSD